MNPANENHGITKPCESAATVVPSIDKIDAMDLLHIKNQQIQAILASLFMSLDDADPTQRTVKNTIWAVQDLMEQAQLAADILAAARSLANDC